MKEIPIASELGKTIERWTKGAQRLPVRGPKTSDVHRLIDGTIMQCVEEGLDDSVGHTASSPARYSTVAGEIAELSRSGR
ncbi:hypothetical protein [Streptomyces sp. NPDC054783]